MKPRRRTSAKDGVPAGYDGVVAGCSIHMGRHDKQASAFVRGNRETLEKIPSAFFSVSPAAHGDEGGGGRVRGGVRDPDRLAPGGWWRVRWRVAYTHYGFLKRRLLKKIASDKPGSLGTDTSRDHVYTDWDEVRRFAEAFLEQYRVPDR